MRNQTNLCGCAGILLASAAAAAPVHYAYDDGEGTFNIGPSQFDAQVTWGNAFMADPDGQVINAISVSFGTGLAAGSGVTLAIYDDPTPDFDPRDAVLVSTTEVLSQTTGFDGFARYDIGPVTVSGQFFVAISTFAVQGQNVARMDENTLGDKSWLFYSDPPMPGDLAAAPFGIRMSDSPFDGTWMVRAEGVVPSPAGLSVLLGTCLLATKRRR